MKHRFIHALVALLCLTAVGLTSAAPPKTSAASYAPTAEECSFLRLINTYRSQNGLGSLALSVTLGAAARHHADDMATHNYLGHTLSNGTSAHQNMINYGYSATAWWGENIYAGYGTGSNGIDNASALGAFTWWQNSSNHNANMLSANFKAIGIARAYNANSTYQDYWTTDFGGIVGATVRCG